MLLILRTQVAMFHTLIKTVNNRFPFTDSDIDNIKKYAQLNEYSRGENIAIAGDVVHHIYYVLKGCIRLYYNVDGRDKTAFFYDEGSFIWDCDGMNVGKVTQKNLQAIEDTMALKIGRLAMLRLQKMSANFQAIANQAKEHELIMCQNLVAQFITLSPEERFVELMETNKTLFQRAPQQYIASYLGVSAETLCRIKNRVYRKRKELVNS